MFGKKLVESIAKRGYSNGGILADSSREVYQIAGFLLTVQEKSTAATIKRLTGYPLSNCLYNGLWQVTMP